MHTATEPDITIPPRTAAVPLNVVESALAPLGCPLERAASRDRALKALVQGNIMLVLLDVLLPDATGDGGRPLHAPTATRRIGPYCAFVQVLEMAIDG